MAKGKGGESTQEVKIPKALENAAKENLKLAGAVATAPPMHNFGGTVAAFTPQQMAGMAATDQMAGSLGLPTAGFGASGVANTGMNIPGMPPAQNFGGFQGYSTQGLFQDAMKRVPPEVQAAIAKILQGSYSNSPSGGTSAPVVQPPVRSSYNPNNEPDYSQWGRR